HRLAALVGVAMLLMVTLPWYVAATQPVLPFGQWLFCTPLMLMGIALGGSYSLRSNRVEAADVGVVVAATILASVVGWARSGNPSYFIYTGAVALVAIALVVPVH